MRIPKQISTMPMPSRSISIPVGHTLILDATNQQANSHLQISQGLIRVSFCNRQFESTGDTPITIGFLQTGDQISLNMLCNSSLHLEAIRITSLMTSSELVASNESIDLANWSASLLSIQHLPGSEQRLRALLKLLVLRLGQRKGNWYCLPMRLKHECLAEMVNHTRVTVSRHMARWRRQGLIDPGAAADGCLLLAPSLIDS